MKREQKDWLDKNLKEHIKRHHQKSDGYRIFRRALAMA
jgi:hypothetical protein